MDHPAADTDPHALAARAAAHWHALLEGPLGPPSAARLEDELVRRRLVFGDRPVCRVLRPLFVAEGVARALAAEVETLMRAFRVLRRALDEDRDLRAVLALSPGEEEVLAFDRQGFEPDVVARIDGFLSPAGFQVIEYNAESPGGIGFGDALAEAFQALPVMEAFRERFRVTTWPGLANTLEALLAAHRARVGTRGPARPSIAVVDRRDAPTRREFELCAEAFARRGDAARVVDPGELRIEGGRLVAGEFAIDVVYKRVLVKDLLDREGPAHPLFEAVRRGLVTCASGLGVHVLYRKELFALFHDARVRERLDGELQAAVDRLVPWTHLVRPVAVEHRGRRQPLLELAIARQHELVLKPTAEYGGSGVVLGWTVDARDWERAVRAAMDRGFVLQERVMLPRETFPVRGPDGRVAFVSFHADINPYVWNGARSRGFGGRLAPGELLNVTAGGGSAVPVMAVGDPATPPAL